MSFLSLETDTVQHVRTIDPIVVAPGDSIQSVLTAMKDGGQGSVLVCDEGKLTGIFTERDALQLMVDGTDMSADVRTVMTSNPVTIPADETVSKAIRLMAEGGYRRLPITNSENELLGVVKVSHILHYLVEHFPEYIYNLPPTPHHTTQEREGA